MKKTKPSIILVAPEKPVYFEEIYGDTVDMLRHDFCVREAQSTQLVRDYIQHSSPMALLITECDLLAPEFKDLLDTIVTYHRQGGMVIFCCGFSNNFPFTKFKVLFKDHFDVPWTCAAYQSDQLYRRTDVLEDYTTLTPPQMYINAVILGNVDQNHILYGSSIGDSASPIVWKKKDQHGALGFIGAVNGEKEVALALLAMCLQEKPYR